ITSDISIGLRTSVDVAEAVKLAFGTAVPKNLSKWDDIDLTQFDPNETERISQKQVAEIIEARCEEICTMVNDRLAAIDRVAKLPGGIILTGGGARLPGMVELAKRVFKLSVQIGTAQVAFTTDERIGDPIFSTALGLVLWGAQGQHTDERDRTSAGGSFLNKVSSLSLGNIRRFVESLLP
ncbi:MAG: cell division FtsA domain-containing protein, partial [bacterium]|nr:cell division FtsA domain-containing protein [bacterium]